MAIAVEALSSEELAQELLRQASTLDTRAERLRLDAQMLSREAAGLRAEASTVGRPSVGFVEPYHVEQDGRLLSLIRRTLEKHGPSSSTHVAETIDVRLPRVRSALLKLEEAGEVKRGGLKRGTVWALADDDAIEAVRNTADARTQVRDAVRELGTFTFPEISEVLPFTDVTIRRWLTTFVEEGTLEAEKVGTAKLYAYAPPKGPTPARPKHEPPELRVIEQARRSPAPVAGTGQRERAASAIVNELLRELRSKHPQVEIKRRSHKFAFYFDGREISSCSLTPGAASALGETRRRLRQAGVMVAA